MANGVPNFPTPPVKRLDSLSMPNDLVANKRNYYTQIFFTDFRSAAYGAGNIVNQTFDNPIGAGGLTTTAIGAIGGAVLGGAGGGLGGAIIGGVLGGVGGASLVGALSATGGVQTSSIGVGSIKLPIPNKVNDIQTLSWEPISITGTLLRAGSAFLPPAVSQAVQGVGRIGTALVGKSLNPLLFMAFNQQNFREFTFEWVMAPRNQKESTTIRNIVEAFKGASLPSFGFPFQDYPLIATVVMHPNNLNGHAIFKPMAIQAVAVNYTGNPNPSFFENTGAPTIVTLTVKFTEIKLWYRNASGLPY